MGGGIGFSARADGFGRQRKWRRKRTQVELDIFSGRPNPVWGLTGAQIDEMGEIVRTLPLATEEPPAQPGLGYRGFIVTDDARRSWQINAFKGFVQITDQGRVEVRSDRNRKA